METENSETPSPQLLFLGQKSTKRLLEIYVKRSLSLNDKTPRQRRVKPRKWVIVDNKGNRIRKASSDSSTYRLSREISETEEQKDSNKDSTSDSHERETKHKENKPQTRRVTKKPSILRSFINLFSRKSHEQVQNSPSVSDNSVFSGSADSSSVADICPSVPDLPGEERDGNILRHSKSIKKRLSLKKLSFRNHDTDKSDLVRRQSSLAPADVVRVPDAIVCVEPSSTYFEKVSEEFERIVKEVKESPSEEVPPSAAALDNETPTEAASDSTDDIIERMVNILKQEGDEIDERIKRNSSVSSFFQKLNYNNFQQLADRYVAAIPNPLPQTTTAPPQLVKLAFTLDLTAKVAGLSSQAIGRVMGFGNQYIQDRFTQMTSTNLQEHQSQTMEHQNLGEQD